MLKFCLIFDHYCQKIISAGKTRYWATPLPCFEISVIFKILSCSTSTRHGAICTESFLYYISSSILLVANQSCNEKRISPYSLQMRENTAQKKLCIWTLFTQCANFILKTPIPSWSHLIFRKAVLKAFQNL